MNKKVVGYQIFVYDELSKQWYGNETFKVSESKRLAMTCFDYGKQGCEISVREITVEERE